MWKFLEDKSRRETIGWLASGAAAILAAGWAVVVYIVPPQHKPNPANRGSQSVNCGLITEESLRGRDITLNCPDQKPH
jgi:hypothetical protein